MWFMEYIFLARNWALDQPTLEVTYPAITTVDGYMACRCTVSCLHARSCSPAGRGALLALAGPPAVMPGCVPPALSGPCCCCGVQAGFSRLASTPKPIWLCLFVEGTRFTKAKLLAAQEFARSKGRPVPHHTLVPKTKVTAPPPHSSPFPPREA
jgi:hypothetical protein